VSRDRCQAEFCELSKCSALVESDLMELLSDASLFLSIVASIFSKTDFCLSKTAYIESNGAYRWVMAIYGDEVAKNKKAASGGLTASKLP
jgi:hypothetical protein